MTKTHWYWIAGGVVVILLVSGFWIQSTRPVGQIGTATSTVNTVK
jgi:hypothetical protein